MGMTWSDEKEQICIENKKMKKWKTSPPKKIVSLGGDVFRYAKYFTICIICTFPWAKCFFLKSEFSSFSQSICYKSIIFWPILLKFLLQPPLVFSSAHQEWCCPWNDFSPSKKNFSLNTPNFCKIVVIPFLKVFGINMAVFMPQTFRKKSGTLLSNHKTNSGFQ